MPPPPDQQFLAFILDRHKQLRDADRLPETVDAWNQQKSSLREKLLSSWGGFPKEPCGLAPRQVGEIRRDGYRVEKIVFETRPGVLMTANAYVPDRKGKLPAVLCVHGHWKGAKQDPVPQSRCIGLAKLGFFVLAVDAFGAGERGIGKALGEYHGEMVGTTLFPTGFSLAGLQVYENMRAVDYLLTRPEVDGTKLGITGASGGGNQTMYAGAFDERFRCVVPVCSVGTYRSYLGAACCVCEVVPDAMSYTEEWALLAMVAPRALMVINATRDANQFSVGEAQQSIAKAQHVFRLHGKAANVTHTIFESGHDYSQAMREAMYGWMTLHLKGEGQGNPIPEPALTPEEPETLRCFPGESRPDDFVTLPRFAAAEADRLIAGHNGQEHQHREHWSSTTMRMQHALVNDVFGGFPAPAMIPVRETDKQTFVLETEPGIEVTASLETGDRKSSRIAVLIDLEGIDQARKSELSKELLAAGWNVALTDLRATGRYAVAGDRIGRAPDHNSAEWSFWTGRPLLGQWAWDIQQVCSFFSRMREPAEISLFGVRAGAIAALCAAGLPGINISRLVLINPLTSFRSDVPYIGQRMGTFAPRVLRDVGDVPHILAMVAPRKVLISGGTTGDGQPVDLDTLRARFAATRQIYRQFGAEGNLALTPTEPTSDLVKRLD